MAIEQTKQEITKGQVFLGIGLVLLLVVGYAIAENFVLVVNYCGK